MNPLRFCFEHNRLVPYKRLNPPHTKSPSNFLVQLAQVTHLSRLSASLLLSTTIMLLLNFCYGISFNIFYFWFKKKIQLFAVNFWNLLFVYLESGFGNPVGRHPSRLMCFQRSWFHPGTLLIWTVHCQDEIQQRPESRPTEPLSRVIGSLESSTTLK